MWLKGITLSIMSMAPCSIGHFALVFALCLRYITRSVQKNQSIVSTKDGVWLLTTKTM